MQKRCIEVGGNLRQQSTPVGHTPRLAVADPTGDIQSIDDFRALRAARCNVREGVMKSGRLGLTRWEDCHSGIWYRRGPM